MAQLKGLPRRMGRAPVKVPAPPKQSDRFYQSDEWKKLRKDKLAQGPAFCCVCGTAKGKLILDHREERKDGGADLPSLDQLDWYCVGDHNRKTAAAKAARVRQR